MDNTQDPVVAPQQGEAQPTVEQMPDVQPVEVPAEPSKSSDETNFESVAAKKGFKTPDDLAKAYANLESQNTKVSMKAAELEKQFFPDSPKTTEQRVEKAYSDDEQKALSELRSFISREAVEPLKQEFDLKLRTELAKIELSQVIKDNPDFANYANEVKEFKSKYPDMPFREAYTFAKALKGDLVKEARAEGLRQGTWSAERQSAAQVVPSKRVTEEKIGASDLLKGAGQRWAIRQGMTPDQKNRIRAEQALAEKEIFGYMLENN